MFKIYIVAALTSALLSAISKIISNIVNGYRGWKVLKYVSGAAVGSAINTILLMKFIRQGRRGLLIAALVASCAQGIIDYIESIIRRERQSFKQLTLNWLLSVASNYIGNYIGYRLIKIDGNWFQPQHVKSFFAKPYGQRIISQTGIGAAFASIINIIVNRLEKRLKNAR